MRKLMEEKKRIEEEQRQQSYYSKLSWVISTIIYKLNQQKLNKNKN